MKRWRNPDGKSSFYFGRVTIGEEKRSNGDTRLEVRLGLVGGAAKAASRIGGPKKVFGDTGTSWGALGCFRGPRSLGNGNVRVGGLWGLDEFE